MTTNEFNIQTNQTLSNTCQPSTTTFNLSQLLHFSISITKHNLWLMVSDFGNYVRLASGVASAHGKKNTALDESPGSAKGVGC